MKIRLFKNRLFILFLVVVLIHILLKRFCNINLFNFDGGYTLEGFMTKDDLPCVDYPNNINDPIELQTNVKRLCKSIENTAAALDNIVGEAIKNKHSDKLYNSSVEKFFLKVEEKCKKIKVDKKGYTYRDIDNMKNLTAKERKKVNEADSKKLKNYDEEATDAEKSKKKKLLKEIKENYDKFMEAKEKYMKKKKKYITEEKFKLILKYVNTGGEYKGIPAYVLLTALFNRIKYKPSFKKNVTRYLIESELTMLEGVKEISKKILTSKLYKEFNS